MKNAASKVEIAVDALRVGMFVHLDVGWMSHPFALSSFRISSAEQIAVIRSLGIKRLRWSPEQSALLQASDEAARVIEAASRASLQTTGAAATTSRLQRAQAASPASTLAQCEHQFAEATRECRRLTDLAGVSPLAAGDRARALTQALVGKMLGEQELCIRLLTEAAGDRASAHAVNVTVISLLIGRNFGLEASEMQDLGVGALLHDIGKTELPASVRHHEPHFSATQSACYEQHVTHGVALALKMGLSPGASLVIAQHHEHADGSGFPLNLPGDRMASASRIVALVNRYDNLCNPPVPAKAMTPHEALALLFAQGKNKYDATILTAFIKLMGVYPPGSTVQLTDDRYAMVVAVNASRPLKPRVLVHEPAAGRGQARPLDLQQTPNLGIRRSLPPQALPQDALDALAPRQRVAYFFEPTPEDACT